jgi:hypothetical protein
MRRAIAAVVMVLLVLAVVAPPAQACIECVALGLAAFAVFNQFVWAVSAPRVVYTAPAYYAPAYGVWYGWPYAPAYYAPAPYYPVAYTAAYRTTPYVAAAAPGAWTGARVVQYPHGRYELRGDGVSVPWAWVWVPAAAVPAETAPAATGPATTPLGFSLDGPEGGGGARTP